LLSLFLLIITSLNLIFSFFFSFLTF